MSELFCILKDNYVLKLDFREWNGDFSCMKLFSFIVGFVGEFWNEGKLLVFRASFSYIKLFTFNSSLFCYLKDNLLTRTLLLRRKLLYSCWSKPGLLSVHLRTFFLMLAYDASVKISYFGCSIRLGTSDRGTPNTSA